MVLSAGIDPVVPVNTWASEGHRWPAGFMGPVLKVVGAAGRMLKESVSNVLLPVAILGPELERLLAEVAALRPEDRSWGGGERERLELWPFRLDHFRAAARIHASPLCRYKQDSGTVLPWS